MVTAQIKPGKLDEAVEYWKATVAPTASEQPGYVSARMLVDRPANRVRSISIWETAADSDAAAVWTKGHIARFGEYLAGPPVLDAFDMVAEYSKE
jgi:heme-degrading monooxygenase HmoA